MADGLYFMRLIGTRVKLWDILFLIFVIFGLNLTDPVQS